MKRRLVLILAVMMIFSMLDVGVVQYNATGRKTVDRSDNTIVYTEDFEDYANSEEMRSALGQHWTLLQPTTPDAHSLIVDPLDEDNHILHMNSNSGLIWKEALGRYEFSADMKIDPTNDKSTHGTGSALLVRVNREDMAGKPVYESYPEEGRQLGTSGIIIYLWQNNINITVRTFDEASNTVGPVANFGNMRLPNGKDARNDYVNVKVTDDGKGVIKIYLDDIRYVTFTLSEEKELSDGTRTAVFYTKLKAEFSPDINFWDNKNVTEVNNAFVSASNGTISYATRNFGGYVGHYVDNLKMKTEILEIKQNNVYTYLDLTDESVLDSYYSESLKSDTVIERTEEGLHVASVTEIGDAINNMYFVFPELITVTPGNDYYMAIKYRYDDGRTTDFFTNQVGDKNSPILTASTISGDYTAISSGGSRQMKALGNTVNHRHVIQLSDGWNVCFIRIAFEDALDSIKDSDNKVANVKKVRLCIMTESPFTVQSIAVFKDIYGFSSGNTSFEALAAMEYELPTDEKMPLPERYAVYQGSQIRTVLVPYYKNGQIDESETRQGLRFVFDDVPEVDSVMTFNGKEYTVVKHSALVMLKSKLTGELTLSNSSIAPAILEELLEYGDNSKAVYIYNIPREHVDTVIVARVYLECVDEDGNTYYFYGETKEDSLRSVYNRMDDNAKSQLGGEVAEWFIND